MNWPQLKIDYLPLLALGLIPLIWWVSRIIPPKPKTIIFPAKRFLSGLKSEKQEAKKAPVWLKIVRAIGLSALILAIANPILSFEKSSQEVLPKNIILVIEDSYSSAPDYENRQTELKTLMHNLRAKTAPDTQYFLIKTSEQFNGALGSLIEPMDLSSIEMRAAGIKPSPLFFDHWDVAKILEKIPNKAKIYYFSDGLEHMGSQNLRRIMENKAVGKIEIYSPKSNKNAGLIEVTRTNTGFEYQYNSVDNTRAVRVDFYSANHVKIASGSGVRGRGSLQIDNSTARKAAYAKISDVNSAAAVLLFDSFDKRQIIGLEKSAEADQPILSDNHYIKAAGKQFADLYLDDIENLVKAQVNAIVLGDRAGFSTKEAQELEKYVKQGGMLVRYIGPQAISAKDDLLPAKFKSEARNIKDALGVKPLTIAQFARESPFYGLELPSGANPSIISTFDDTEQTPLIWARLTDGTPFISATKLGEGEIVAIHTSAAPYWSDIAFSGLQVGLLKRIISRSQSPILPQSIRPTDLPLNPNMLIDGFGNIVEAPNNANPIQIETQKQIRPNANQLPGIYENFETRLIIQAYNGETSFEPVKTLSPNFTSLSDQANNNFRLQPLFLLLALGVFLFDGLFSIGTIKSIRGLFSSLFSKFKKPVLKVFACLLIGGLLNFQTTNFASAQTINAGQGIGKSSEIKHGIQLAFISANNTASDEIVFNGLNELKAALNNRTSVRASKIVKINPLEIDPFANELALYPIIYWRLADNPTPLGINSQRALNQYMRNGGLLFVDTRGAGLSPAAARANTQIALRGLIVPPLEQVGQSHVLAKSFYLLAGFPGRYGGARLWAQSMASLNVSANDGVSPIIIGDGDYAYAWANKPANTVISNEAIARNAAINTGINIYFYALTGQYKADQVHVPAILERLKKRRGQ